MLGKSKSVLCVWLFVGANEVAIGNAIAQVAIAVPASSVTKGTATTCTIQAGPPSSIPAQAKLTVKFVSDETPPKSAKNPAKVLLQLDGVDEGTIDPGVEEKEFTIAGDTLTNATVELMRDDARVPLCSIVPWPTARSLVPNGPSYTSFVANGEVGKALKGSPSSDVTGSLGVDHRSVPSALDLVRLGKVRKPMRILPWYSMGEELHAILTIAGSADSLASADKAAYGAAVLAPSLSGNGSFQGVTIEYHYFNTLNRAQGTWGPRVKLSVAKSFWRVVDTALTAGGAISSVDTLRASVPLSAFDAGFRFVFISHLQDPKQNTYAVGVDPSFVWRFVSPNTNPEKRMVRAALSGATTRVFRGTNVAFWVRLRQVTGVADLLYIRRGRGIPVGGLTGFQPVVTMKYSSPLFVF
jgi:hypothetical protein